MFGFIGVTDLEFIAADGVQVTDLGLVVADGWQACGSALAALRAIVHALRGWPTPLGATLNSAMQPFDESGALREERDAVQVETVAQQVVAFARAWSCAD